MKKIIFTAILFFSLFSFGQTPISKVVFYDSIGKETFSKDYSFKEIIKEFNLEKAIYEVEYFQKNQDKFILKSRYFVNDKNKLTRHGECVYYYETGKTREIKDYENGQPIKSKSWYENGKIESEKRYFFDDKEGQYKYYIDNYWDENNNNNVINGNGTLEELLRENDTLIFTGIIKNGLKDGVWKTKNSNYPKIEELYENGILKNGILYKSSIKIRKYSLRQVNAAPICGFTEFKNRLGQRIKSIKFKPKHNGRIIVKFVVDENGNLTNFQSENNLPENLYKQLINSINAISVWEPSLYNGREVKQHFTLPIIIQFIESE